MWIYIHVDILVLLQAGYLIAPGIVAVVVRHVRAIQRPINKVSIFTGQDLQPCLNSVSVIVHLAN